MNQSLTEIAEEIGVNDAFRKVVDLVFCLKDEEKGKEGVYESKGRGCHQEIRGLPFYVQVLDLLSRLRHRHHLIINPNK